MSVQRLENSGYNSSYSLHIRSSDKFWPAENSCQAVLNANGMAAGDTVTLRYMARWIHGCPEPTCASTATGSKRPAVLPIPAQSRHAGRAQQHLHHQCRPGHVPVTHSPARARRQSSRWSSRPRCTIPTVCKA
jgi:hypothetical protein